MGGLLGKNRAAKVDPFYQPVPPIGPPPPGYDPSGGLGAYGPYEEYGSEPIPTMGNYGRPIKRRPNPFGGRYAQGLNQVPGVAPWNYGNYYLGNTTMQMMPFMLNKIHQYGQMQAMSALGNAGLLGSAPIMQSMPMIPPSFSMPMAAPLMAAATPLPIAFNPLVQGMYPMASMNPVSWMTPSSFMSALTSGPMPYRPPAFDFPSNIGMVMTVPYGTPNPLLSSPSFGGFGGSGGFGGFGGFGSSYNFGGGSPWCCCCYCMPSATAPAPPSISYYPRPVSAPQPYSIPYPAPVAIPNIQQVPVPRPVSFVAPPIVAGGNQTLPVSATALLSASQGVFVNGGFGRPAVMSSNTNSATHTPINNQAPNSLLPVYDATDQSRFLIGQQVTPNLPNLGSNNNQQPTVTPSQAKNENQLSQDHNTLSDRFRRHIPSIPYLSRSNYNLTTSQPRSNPIVPPVLHGQVIFDSGWLPKTAKLPTITSILSGKSRKRLLYSSDNGKSMLASSSSRVSFIPRRRGHHSNSSISEYDCAICQQQREQRRLREYYGSSTVSSLLSSPKDSRKRHLSPNESFYSSTAHTPASSKQQSHKSHRRHPTRIKTKSKSSTSQKSSSPVLLRQSPIQEQRSNGTIHEEEKEEEEEEKQQQQPIEKKLVDDNESATEKSDQYGSKISLRSIDE